MRTRSGGSVLLGLGAFTALAAGCGEVGSSGAWAGTIDTLPSGHVVVHNPAEPLWEPGSEWRLVEELRIGRVEGRGPDVFGRVASFEVDPAGRVWVLESQAQELRAFDASGEHVRTIGRRGGGPGEFAQAVKVEVGPDGNVWVMDPGNARISVFDTAGTYVEGKPAAGGLIMVPWPGRFDAEGHYYAPVPRAGSGGFGIALVRYDASLAPIDTIEPLRDPIPRESFEIRDAAGRLRVSAGVPYQGGLSWLISPAGTRWALISDRYRFFELAPTGDTLRTITREFEPPPVTSEDLERVADDMKWFTDQGGRIDRSKIPDTKPPVSGFFLDDEGDLWVGLTAEGEEADRLFDVFDPAGRYLGTVRCPFPLSRAPHPIVRNGLVYGLTRDELDVAYVVRARIVKP